MMDKLTHSRGGAGRIMTSTQPTGRRGSRHRRRLRALLAAALLFAAAAPALAERAQQSFASPEQAAGALFAADQANDKAGLLKIFGSGGGKLVRSGDPVADRNGRARFAAAYGEMHKIEPEGVDKAVLLIGKEEWPFPIPLVKAGTARALIPGQAQRRSLNHGISRNQLKAHRGLPPDGGGRPLVQRPMIPFVIGARGFAQHFIGPRDRRDKLYWDVAA